jgi:hypothetical protein
MRNRHRSAMYGLAATVALTTTLGLWAAGVANASPHAKPAVTPSCGHYCSAPVYNIEFTRTFFVNNNNARVAPGNPINLSWANDNNPGQDWRVELQGSVHSLYRLGYVSRAMMVHYRHSFASEVMYTPYGVSSNLCRGLRKNAYQGEEVTLQWCGSFPRTLWIIGSNEHYGPITRPAPVASATPTPTPSVTATATPTPAPSSTPVPVTVAHPTNAGNELISASGTNPSVPYLLTAGGGVFGGNPFATLQVDRRTAVRGHVNPGQLWCTAHVYHGLLTPNYPNCFGIGAVPAP